jgi:hypothetical protein
VAGLRRGAADVVIGWPARLAIVVQAVVPEVLAYGLHLVNRLLPAATGTSGDRSHSGWQSLSRWAPSPLTRLTESAAIRNNEVPSGSALGAQR